jgi:(R,R)-butanediol dehydrogenase/meso-butanediol dehydrogenase/diacetyl reductase
VRAAVFHGRGDIRIENLPEPTSGAGEVLLEVHAAGICGTDAGEFGHGPNMFPIHQAHPITGHQGPMVPGHEFAGRVVAVGAGVESIAEGMLVASGAGASCGVCDRCREGRSSLCARYWTVGLQRNGALAQFCTVPASICLDVAPYRLTEDAAALSQPMAIAVHAMRRGRPRPGDVALVVGAGGIGAFLTFALSHTGVQVVVVEQSAERRALAGKLGAAAALDPATAAEEHALASIEPRVCYEVTGSAAGLELAGRAVPKGGCLVIVGLQERPQPLDLRSVALKELTIEGTNAHTFTADMPEAMRLLAVGAGVWSEVAPAALPLEDLVPEGLMPMLAGRSPRIKTLIDPWSTAPRPTRMSPGPQR